MFSSLMGCGIHFVMLFLCLGLLWWKLLWKDLMLGAAYCSFFFLFLSNTNSYWKLHLIFVVLLTWQIDLRQSCWGDVPWFGICGLVSIDSLRPWIVLVPFRHLAYFVVLSGSFLFSSIRLMKTLVHLARRWCCGFALSLVDLLLTCPCCGM